MNSDNASTPVDSMTALQTAFYYFAARNAVQQTANKEDLAPTHEKYVKLLDLRRQKLKEICHLNDEQIAKLEMDSWKQECNE